MREPSKACIHACLSGHVQCANLRRRAYTLVCRGTYNARTFKGVHTRLFVGARTMREPSKACIHACLSGHVQCANLRRRAYTLVCRGTYNARTFKGVHTRLFVGARTMREPSKACIHACLSGHVQCANLQRRAYTLVCRGTYNARTFKGVHTRLFVGARTMREPSKACIHACLSGHVQCANLQRRAYTLVCRGTYNARTFEGVHTRLFVGARTMREPSKACIHACLSGHVQCANLQRRAYTLVCRGTYNARTFKGV